MSRGMPGPASHRTPSMVRAPGVLYRGGRFHEYGYGGESGLRDLPAIEVDRDAGVVALPCRKRNMAGRPSICPATLSNVNCLGRLVQPGGAAISIHPLLHPLRSSHEPIRWMSMRASTSSPGRSFILDWPSRGRALFFGAFHPISHLPRPASSAQSANRPGNDTCARASSFPPCPPFFLLIVQVLDRGGESAKRRPGPTAHLRLRMVAECSQRLFVERETACQ